MVDTGHFEQVPDSDQFLSVEKYFILQFEGRIQKQQKIKLFLCVCWLLPSLSGPILQICTIWLHCQDKEANRLTTQRQNCSQTTGQEKKRIQMRSTE